MLEIIFLYRFCKRIGKLAREKGHPAIGYQLMTVFFWFAGELGAGLLVGVAVGLLYPRMANAYFIPLDYVSAFCGAIFAIKLAFQIVGNLPDLTLNAAATEPPVTSGARLSDPTTLPPALAGAISAEPMALAPIALHPQPTLRTTSIAKPKSVEPEVKDTIRELIETVVFVVVLVLMLKTFLAEAFVIPTGSMADTLLGYHHKVTCEQCGYPNLVNASSEAEPQDGAQRVDVESCQCQNCGANNVLARPKRVPGGN